MMQRLIYTKDPEIAVETFRGHARDYIDKPKPLVNKSAQAEMTLIDEITFDKPASKATRLAQIKTDLEDLRANLKTTPLRFFAKIVDNLIAAIDSANIETIRTAHKALITKAGGTKLNANAISQLRGICADIREIIQETLVDRSNFLASSENRGTSAQR